VLNNLKLVIHFRKFILVIFLLSFWGTSSAQQGPNLPPKYVDGIMAVIGEKIIRSSDFETEKMDMARGQTLKDSHLLYCLLFEKLIAFLRNLLYSLQDEIVYFLLISLCQ
jgi:hypothetical protein